MNKGMTTALVIGGALVAAFLIFKPKSASAASTTGIQPKTTPTTVTTNTLAGDKARAESIAVNYVNDNAGTGNLLPGTVATVVSSVAILPNQYDVRLHLSQPLPNGATIVTLTVDLTSGTVKSFRI